MPFVRCDVCGTEWLHHGPGPIEDHCRNGGPPGEYLTILRPRTSRL